MNEFNYNQLHFDKNFAFVDITSVSTLSNNLDLLTAKISNNSKYTEIRKRINSVSEAQCALEILSRLIAYDSLVIDKIGIQSASSRIDSEILDLVEVTKIPQTVYDKAANEVHSMINTNNFQTAEENSLSFGSNSSYEDYFDDLFKISSEITTIADTGTNLPRVLFYLLLSEGCQSPVFLSPSKDRLLSYLLDSCLPCVRVIDLQESIENNADKVLVNAINELSNSVLSLPPLSDYIVEMAYKKKISIISAMHEVKKSKDAVAFRSWRHEMHRNNVLCTRSSLLEAGKQWKEMERIVNKWSEDLDIGLGVTHKYKMFKVGLTDDLLKNIGIKVTLPNISLNIKDPVLNPKRHLKFISSWYKNNTL